MRVAFFNTQAYEKPFYISNKDINFEFIDVPLSIDTVSSAHGCDAVCAFVGDDLSADVVAELHRLGVKHIALRSTGYNHVDLAAAASFNIVVTHVPSYSPESIAEFSLTLLLACLRQVPSIIHRTDQLDFTTAGLMGRLLTGCTVGVIGTGEIGCAFAKLLQGFDCQLLGYDPQRSARFEVLGGEYVDLDTLYAGSDVISLHCPLNDATQHLLNDEAFARMQAGVVIINTARGRVIDTAALLMALESGQVGAAGLDVLEGEQAIFYQSHDELADPQLKALLAHPSVMVAPHVAFFTQRAIQRIAEVVIANLLSGITDQYQHVLKPAT